MDTSFSVKMTNLECQLVSVMDTRQKNSNIKTRNYVRNSLFQCCLTAWLQEDAQKWFNQGSSVSPHMAIWCYSAALHFSAGDNEFQSKIYSYRALSHYNIGDKAEFEKDIEEAKKLDVCPPLVSFFHCEIPR